MITVLKEKSIAQNTTVNLLENEHHQYAIKIDTFARGSNYTKTIGWFNDKGLATIIYTSIRNKTDAQIAIDRYCKTMKC